MAHELLFARADPWGPLTVTCRQCGPVPGEHDTVTAAEHAHRHPRAERMDLHAMALDEEERRTWGRAVARGLANMRHLRM